MRTIPAEDIQRFNAVFLKAAETHGELFSDRLQDDTLDKLTKVDAIFKSELMSAFNSVDEFVEASYLGVKLIATAKDVEPPTPISQQDYQAFHDDDSLIGYAKTIRADAANCMRKLCSDLPYKKANRIITTLKMALPTVA